MHFLKVAFFLMRRRSVKQKALAVEKDGSKSIWRKLVGSMRPLHLQSNQSPPPTLESRLPAVAEAEAPPTSENKINDFHSDKASPSVFGSPVDGEEYESQDSPSVHDETESRYASALALNELVDQSEENEQEECEGYVDEDGDVMIDAKAEQFIAQFYEQMRLQSFNSFEVNHSH
ncbi:hypothetical protein L6164_034749 [Bauhinia variegata]|nr:hypothetical protein L6164_034749 [Bauhinia variegata]